MKLNRVISSQMWIQTCIWRFLQALTLEINAIHTMWAALNVSYGWNVLKRINNNYFSSNSLLFLTNSQQLKAFVAAPVGVLLRSYAILPCMIRLFLTRLDWDLSGHRFICCRTHRRLTLQLGVITTATSSWHLRPRQELMNDSARSTGVEGNQGCRVVPVKPAQT